MRIESLHIDKFGKLRSFDLAFPEGLTIVRGDNESGKTTILAFLRAMLYGLNGKSASIAQNDRRKYMPWGETSMGGSLRLTDGRTAWEIARVFGQTKKQDTLRVTDLASGEAVELPAGDEPGRVLLGVDEAVFADTLYVSARGSRPSGDGAALTDKIRNLVGTGSEDVDLKSVLDRLRAAKNAIAPRVKDKGQLAAVQREQDEVQRALLASAQEQQELARLRERVQALSDAPVTAAGRATAARAHRRPGGAGPPGEGPRAGRPCARAPLPRAGPPRVRGERRVRIAVYELCLCRADRDRRAERALHARQGRAGGG